MSNTSGTCDYILLEYLCKPDGIGLHISTINYSGTALFKAIANLVSFGKS